MARIVKCSVCGSRCMWGEDAWVCDRKSCGSEWNTDHDPSYAAPGDPLTFAKPDQFQRGDHVRDKDGELWIKGTLWWHWTGRSVDTGPGKLLWNQLMDMYGPLRDET